MDNLKQLSNNKECQEWKQIRLPDSYVAILIQNQLWVKWKGQVEINRYGHWPATHGLEMPGIDAPGLQCFLIQGIDGPVQCFLIQIIQQL